MYPLSVPWNNFHSSMYTQQISVIAWYDIFDQLCDGHRKNKNKKKQSEKSKNLALLGLAVQIEYLSNLCS